MTTRRLAVVSDYDGLMQALRSAPLNLMSPTKRSTR